MKRMQILLLMAVVLGAVNVACSQEKGRSSTVSSTPCTPVDMGPANAPEQKPAFAGQTRACAVTSGVAFDVTVLAKGLNKPWAVEPLPDGSFLITEKQGQLRIISAKGDIGEPIAVPGGSPPIAAQGQGGLLDVALSPQFEKDATIYWSFSERREGGSGTSVARGMLTADRKGLEQVKVIFRAMPTFDNGMHFGSRLAFGPDEKLYITLGDRFDIAKTRPQAQQLNSHLGKVIRINADGTVPDDNPFVKQKDALPEIWSVGHRNIQSASIDDKGRLWTIEHGAKGGDELNLIEKGKNYGWAVITYGEEYSGQPINGGVTAKAGYEQPAYYWDPVIAPSGAQYYTGNAFPAWRGSIFIGGLASQRLVRVVIDGERVTGEEHLLTDRGKRIRDVRQGPDGALYVVTDEQNGELWKIAPRR